MVIISLTKSPSGIRALEGHSWLTDPAQIPDGFIGVPEALETKLIESQGYCDLVIEDGNLVDIIATERPAPEPQPPTQDDRLRAMEAAILTMAGEIYD